MRQRTVTLALMAILLTACSLVAQQVGGTRGGTGPKNRREAGGAPPGPHAGVHDQQQRGPRGPMGGRHGGDNPEAMIHRILENPQMAREMGLGEKEIASIKEGLYALREQAVNLRAQLQVAAMKQAKLMTDEELDEEALMEAVEETGQIHTELAKLKIKGLLLVRKHVSAEQVAAMRSRAREKMRERWQDRETERGGPRRGERGRRVNPPERDGTDSEVPGNAPHPVR